MLFIYYIMEGKIINDCIHGCIKISPLCLKFIDHPKFQKLRRIKQLGNAYRVYPSATHTRFEHSLGVMHLAGKFAKSLRINKMIFPLCDGKRMIQLIQLAGLYHDIGHLPYSHLFDKILEAINPDNILHNHEDRSVEIFKLVSDELKLLSYNEELFVIACIKGKYISSLPRFLFQIISGPIDVDKLDYLSRDAFHTGMNSFRSEYIINNARINADNNIVFKLKAKTDIVNMFKTRETMHELVYQHKVNLDYDTIYMCMIYRIFDELKLDNLCDYKLDSILLEHEKTKHIFSQLEYRKKDHKLLNCDINHPIITKKIYQSGTINDILFI